MFLLNVPLAAAALVVTVRHVPESRDTTVAGRLDLAGAGSVTAGLGGIIYALIEAPVHGWTTLTVMALVVGVWALAAFPLIEHRQPAPLIPLSLFHSAQFVGANLVTLAVYTGLGGALFLLALQLQQSLGFTATAAELSFLPFTVIMLLLSSRIGALAQCIGPRWPMTIGPLVAGGGLALLVRAVPGASYLSGVTAWNRGIRSGYGRHRGAVDLHSDGLRGGRTRGRRLRGQQRRFPDHQPARRSPTRRWARQQRHRPPRFRICPRDAHLSSAVRPRQHHRGRTTRANSAASAMNSPRCSAAHNVWTISATMRSENTLIVNTLDHKCYDHCKDSRILY